MTHDTSPRTLTILMTSAPRFPWRAFAAVLLTALVGRALLLASGSVSFHSDEAVVALMARHINQGERPVFFYGQAYMGSLDAGLIALGFRVLGESVAAIRVVQAILYLLIVAGGFAAAWRLSGRPLVAAVAGLSLAVPPVLLAVYTSATLGGYNETLLFGNLLLLLGYDLTHAAPRSTWRWALLGLIGGLGWWTNGLIVAFAAPVGLLLLYRLLRPVDPQRSGSIRQRAALVGVAVLFFFVGSAPWWIFNLQHNWMALAFYVARGDTPGFAGNAVPDINLTLQQRVLGLFFLGLPTLIGLRFPWQPTFFAPMVGAVLIFIYALALVRLALDRRPALKPDARALILGMIGLFCVIFFVSKFSIDPTGRYFLPLALPLGVALGTLVDRLPPSRRLAQAALVVVVVGYNAAGQLSAASVQPGLTTQFNLETHIPNDDDQALIGWLDAHHLYTGYTTYWIAFRLAFLSGERMQFSSSLPYKSTLQYTPADERYPAYRQAADGSDDVAYITANVEAVRLRLEAAFARLGVTYDAAVVGPFHIYYHFRPQVPRPPLDLSAP